MYEIMGVKLPLRKISIFNDIDSMADYVESSVREYLMRGQKNEGT